MTVIRITEKPLQILSVPFKEFKKIFLYHRIFNEYMVMRVENEQLRAQATAFNELLLENTRLEQLLDFKTDQPHLSMAAHVIGRNPNQWSSSLWIDRGSNDDIEVGDPVVNAYGVVGKVLEVTLTRSKVLLITDPQFKVPAIVQRSREAGLVTGRLDGQSQMSYLKSAADIQIGDVVITSRLSDDFPENLVVGTIIDIVDQPETGDRLCILQPAVSLSLLEEVLIVTSGDML